MQNNQNRLWDYKILEQIGQGQSGIVYKVINKKTSAVQALKKIPIASMSDTQKRETYCQAKILQKLSHPNVVKYHESFISAEHLYIVMDYARKGDLLVEFLQRRSQLKNFREAQLWEMFGQLALGIKYLHGERIMHRDIKLQNIFMGEDGTLLLGDLGLSKLVHQRSPQQNKRVGTPIYFAPEIIQHQPYSFPVDLWALGCVFYSLTNLVHPFQHAILQNLAELVIIKPLRALKSFYSHKLCNLIPKMLERDPSLRISANDLVDYIAGSPGQPQRVQVFNRRFYHMLSNDAKLQKKKLLDRQKEQFLLSSSRHFRMRGFNLDNQEDQHDQVDMKQTPIDLDQLLKTVKRIRPKSLRLTQRSNTTRMPPRKLTSEGLHQTSDSFCIKKSFLRNNVFDYIVRPFSQASKRRLDIVFAKG